MKRYSVALMLSFSALFPSASFAQKSYSNDEAIIEFVIILFFGAILGVIFLREFIHERMIPAIHNYFYPPPLFPDELTQQNESPPVENVGLDETISDERILRE